MKTAKYFTFVALVGASVAFAFAVVVILLPDRFEAFTHFRETTTALATLAMVIATLVMAFATFGLIESSDRQAKRYRNERRLREMLEWTEEIKSSSLTSVAGPLDTATIASRQLSVEMNHARALSKGETMLHVSSYLLDRDLVACVQEVVHDLVALLFLESGTPAGFRGRYLEIVAGLERKIADNTSRDSLFTECATRLAVSVNRLSCRICELMSRL